MLVDGVPAKHPRRTLTLVSSIHMLLRPHRRLVDTRDR